MLENCQLQIVLIRQFHIFGDDLLKHDQDTQPAIAGDNVFQIFAETGFQEFIVGAVQIRIELFIVKEALEHKGGAGTDDGETVVFQHGLRYFLNIVSLGDNFFGMAHKDETLRRGHDAAGGAVEEGIADLLFHIFDNGTEMGLGNIAIPGRLVHRAAFERLQDIDQMLCIHTPSFLRKACHVLTGYLK